MRLNKINLMILLIINIIIPLLSSVIAKEQGVPVLIWSNYEDITFPAISSIDYLPQKSFIKDILEKTRHSGVKIITFVQERLSLEDFTSHNPDELHNLDNILNTSLSSYFLTNVENPLLAIEKIRERNVKQNSLNGLDADDDSVVIIDLPSASDLVANDAIIGRMTQDIGKIQDKTIVMLTGRENSYADEEIHRVARHIMAEPKSSKKGQSQESGHLVEVPVKDPCLFVYSIGGSFILTVHESKDRSKPSVSYSSKFPAKPSSSSGKCAEHDESGKEKVPASLKLTWNSLANGTTLSLDFTISVSKRGYYWRVKEIEANVANSKVKKTMFLNPEKLEAASGFSFSCRNLSLCNDWNVTDDTLTYFRVHLSRFQFQPNLSSSKSKTFDDSFDCSTFFTIPLWMGFFTILLFIIIVCVGVFLLMELSTMDRFENPKGKTITINASD